MQTSTINLSTNPSLMEQIVPHTTQMHPDYLDNLHPGYRFCPTDAELICYYLKQKIETGEHPKCRIYEVNLYHHTPEQLTRNYRGCEGKWYFLTSRERKYEKGDVPNRRTGDFGYWKTTQKYTSVYDDVIRGRVVGRRRSLAYHDEKGLKTPWLMHEYTTDDPNLPVGSGQYCNKVLTDWVLCTIYKKKNSKRVEAHQVFAREEVENHSMLIPPNSSQFSHAASCSTSINPHANYVPQSPIFYHSMSTPTNSFQFSNGASTSTSFEPHTHHVAPPPPYTSLLTSRGVRLDASQDTSQQNHSTLIATKSFQFSDGDSGSISVKSLADVPMDDEDNLDDFDVSQWISIEELMNPQFEP
ncbi:hypothetical protein L1987_68147 [Smallanthus sonchifolius]|uniref:Uncharacterized protein n=1 Tax=Smallanthus sonchifolius TaxID=185202 RepID=A0ACB9B4P9_9ASTR|nr:hypothetical protein L1987_68147 [Smallanthus sonchifolius]